ncbi:unnamed protein product [Sphagnum balticum]
MRLDRACYTQHDGQTDGQPTGVVTSGFFVILFGVASLVPPPACCLRKLRFCVAPPIRLFVRPLAAVPACLPACLHSGSGIDVVFSFLFPSS